LAVRVSASPILAGLGVSPVPASPSFAGFRVSAAPSCPRVRASVSRRFGLGVALVAELSGFRVA
jgi:hypothetical protein